jgi:hypothetical protein
VKEAREDEKRGEEREHIEEKAHSEQKATEHESDENSEWRRRRKTEEH